MLNRSTRGTINCKFNRRIVFFLLAIAGMPLSTEWPLNFALSWIPIFIDHPLR